MCTRKIYSMMDISSETDKIKYEMAPGRQLPIVMPELDNIMKERTQLSKVEIKCDISAIDKSINDKSAKYITMNNKLAADTKSAKNKTLLINKSPIKIGAYMEPIWNKSRRSLPAMIPQLESILEESSLKSDSKSDISAKDQSAESNWISDILAKNESVDAISTKDKNVSTNNVSNKKTTLMVPKRININKSLSGIMPQLQSILEESSLYSTIDSENNISSNNILINNKSADIKLINNKSADDKLINNKSADDKLIINKSADDKLINNKSADDKLIINKSADDNWIDDILAAHESIYRLAAKDKLFMNTFATKNKSTNEANQENEKELTDTETEGSDEMQSLLQDDLIGLADEDSLINTVGDIVEALKILVQYRHKLDDKDITSKIKNAIETSRRKSEQKELSNVSLQSCTQIRSLSKLVFKPELKKAIKKRKLEFNNKLVNSNEIRPSVDESLISLSGITAAKQSTISLPENSTCTRKSSKIRVKTKIKDFIRIKFRKRRFNKNNFDYIDDNTLNRIYEERVSKLKKKLKMKSEECEKIREIAQNLRNELNQSQNSISTQVQCDHKIKKINCNVLISNQKAKIQELKELLHKNSIKLHEANNKLKLLSAANQGRIIALNKYKELFQNKRVDLEMHKIKEQSLSVLCSKLSSDSKERRAQLYKLKHKIEKLINVIKEMKRNSDKQLQLLYEENEQLKLSQSINAEHHCVHEENAVDDKMGRVIQAYSENIDKASDKLIQADTKIKELYSAIEIFIKKVHTSLYGSAVNKVNESCCDELNALCSMLKMDKEEIANVLSLGKIPTVDEWLKKCNSLVYQDKFAEDFSSFLLSLFNIR